MKNIYPTKNKKISVIVPCYNYGNYLSEAIESLIKQTKKADEIIIADDCSSDNTKKIAEKYTKKFPKLIKYYKNKKNLGITRNFNKAVSLSTGDYVCLLGADNRFKNTYLEKTSNILDHNPKIAIAYTDFELFGPKAKERYKTFNVNYQGKKNFKNNTYIINFPNFNKKTKIIQKTNNFIHGSSLYRKKAFNDVKGYLNKKNTPEDQNLFTRIINKGWGAKRISEPLLEYRQHSDDQANIKLQNKIKINNLEKEKTSLEEKNYLLHQEVQKLSSDLEKIQSSKTYKLWQRYNNIKKILYKKISITMLYNSKIFLFHKFSVLILHLNQQKKLGFKISRYKKPIIILKKNNNIPSLSWICKINKNKYSFTIGNKVENTKKLIFEGAWSGNFENITNLNKSEFVFGSGALINKKITFIPPKHIFEGLFVIKDKKNKISYVSNSLVYIINKYIKTKKFIIKKISTKLNTSINIASELGIDRYSPKILETKKYILYRMLFYNFNIDNDGNIKTKLLLPKKYFNNFYEYQKFLTNKIKDLFNNAKSKHRKTKYLPISTISKGYDSPTVSIFAKKNGCKEALTLNANINGMNDSGVKLARMIGLTPYAYKHILNMNNKSANIKNLNININPDLEKIAYEFIATGGIGDDIAYYPFRERLKNRILLTGTFGDSVWSKNSEVKPGISCTIPYMKSITEYRLNNNFIFFPVPVLTARFPAPIIKISNSKELQEYSNGSKYDRPICRKIIESFGVPRNWFGINKNATAPNILNYKYLFYKSFVETMKRYS